MDWKTANVFLKGFNQRQCHAGLGGLGVKAKWAFTFTSLYFLTVDAGCPPASSFCHQDFLSQQTVASNCEKRINAYFLRLPFARCFYIESLNVTHRNYG